MDNRKQQSRAVERWVQRASGNTSWDYCQIDLGHAPSRCPIEKTPGLVTCVNRIRLRHALGSNIAGAGRSAASAQSLCMQARYSMRLAFAMMPGEEKFIRLACRVAAAVLGLLWLTGSSIAAVSRNPARAGEPTVSEKYVLDQV